MTKYGCLGLLFVFFHFLVRAQSKKDLKVVETVNKGAYFYIPASALADSINAVVYQYNSSKKVSAAKRPIKIYWVSYCNDGYYDLLITPEQLIFHSSHDNPNPNRLFWVMNIDSLQYLRIKKGLVQKRPKQVLDQSKHYDGARTVYFDEGYKEKEQDTDKWTDAEWAQFDNNCDSMLKKQLNRWLAVFNTYINDPIRKLQLPSGEWKGKLFGYSKEEVGGWLPVQFRRPEEKE